MMAIVQAAFYNDPIYLFENDPGDCDTTATAYVQNENYNDVMHIIGGQTTSMTQLTGFDDTHCLTDANKVPFITYGGSDISNYNSYYFKEYISYDDGSGNIVSYYFHEVNGVFLQDHINYKSVASSATASPKNTDYICLTMSAYKDKFITL